MMRDVFPMAILEEEDVTLTTMLHCFILFLFLHSGPEPEWKTDSTLDSG